MPNIGPLELAIVAIVLLVIFGPKRLPELGRSLGSGMRQFKSSVSGKNRGGDEDEPAHLDGREGAWEEPSEAGPPAPEGTGTARTSS